MYATNEQTLILDQNFAPLKIVHWARAVALWFQGKVEIVSEYDGFARSTSLVIKIPAVVRLLRAFRKHKKPVKFSRVNIYGRDGYKCQYCGTRHSMNGLTYDHVLPRSRGGRTTWTNIVTACERCNLRKANRTPAEAGMALKREPKQPFDVPTVVLEISKQSAPAAWRDFLYWTGELDSD